MTMAQELSRVDNFIGELLYTGMLTKVPHTNSYFYRVPNQVYQMFFDMIPRIEYNTQWQRDQQLEETKARILEQLKVFITDKFPNYVVINIADFSRDEAYKIHPKLQYGMYVQLAEGHYDGTIGIEDSLKQLSYDA